MPGLGDDVGDAGGDPFGKGADDGLALGCEHPRGDFDTGEHEHAAGLLAVRGIGIMRAEDHALDTSGFDGLCAGRGAALGAAGFEGDEDGGATQQLGV